MHEKITIIVNIKKCSRRNGDWTWIFRCVGRQEWIVIVVLATYRSKFRFLRMAFKLLCLCKTCSLKTQLARFSLFWGLLLLLWLQRGIPEMARSGENTGQHACETDWWYNRFLKVETSWNCWWVKQSFEQNYGLCISTWRAILLV